jgi:hypothetical protein
MNPEQLVLEDLSKNFEYFKMAAEIDSLEDIEDVKNVAKCYFKLYLKQQEIISKF